MSLSPIDLKVMTHKSKVRAIDEHNIGLEKWSKLGKCSYLKQFELEVQIICLSTRLSGYCSRTLPVEDLHCMKNLNALPLISWGARFLSLSLRRPNGCGRSFSLCGCLPSARERPMKRQVHCKTIRLPICTRWYSELDARGEPHYNLPSCQCIWKSFVAWPDWRVSANSLLYWDVALHAPLPTTTLNLIMLLNWLSWSSHVKVEAPRSSHFPARSHQLQPKVSLYRHFSSIQGTPYRSGEPDSNLR